MKTKNTISDKLDLTKLCAIEKTIATDFDFVTIWKTGKTYGFNWEDKPIGYTVTEFGVTRTVIDRISVPKA